jgi:hypothetical protein
MESELDNYCLVPDGDCTQLLNIICVPVHNDHMNEAYLSHKHCFMTYLPVNHWFKLRDRSECSCHEGHQIIPIINDNNDNLLPVIIENHITGYWQSFPLSNECYFPDDTVDHFVDFIPDPSPNQSTHDDNEDNNDVIDNDITSVDVNSDDDFNIYIYGDPISLYSPVDFSPIYSPNHDDIHDGSYDHLFIID